MPIQPRLVVLADLDRREIERTKPVANRSQPRKEAGIFRVADPVARAEGSDIMAYICKS
jgi:hypothetical protein